MNFLDYFKYNLPQWAFKNQWVSKFFGFSIVPSDISLQALDFIPHLRNVKGKAISIDDMITFGKDLNNPSTYKESEEQYRLRLLETWNTWHDCGSPKKMKELFDLTIYKLDQTPIISGYTNNYGILEYGEDLVDEVACWKDTPNKWPVFWSAFQWGHGITRFTVFSIFLIDPTLNYNQNPSTHLKSVVDLVNKFKPAHTILNRIYSTDGNGNILAYYEVPYNK